MVVSKGEPSDAASLGSAAGSSRDPPAVEIHHFPGTDDVRLLESVKPGVNEGSIAPGTCTLSTHAGS